VSTQERKKIEKENRRELILKAAETVMEVHGLYGLSIDLISNETQLAKGTIYLYFKSKEEILSSLSMKARKLLFEEFQKISEKRLTPIDQLKEVIKANYLFYKKNPLYYDLVSLYEVDNKLIETEEMYKIGENFTELVVGMAKKAQNEGSLNPKISPLNFAFCLWGMTVGMLQLIKVRGKLMQDKLGISEDDLLNTFIQSVENGIKNK
jgi:TetR/AcrR family transcriptional regulator